MAVVGPSGAGKSTLLMHLNGLLPSPAVVHEDEDRLRVRPIASGHENPVAREQSAVRWDFCFKIPTISCFVRVFATMSHSVR